MTDTENRRIVILMFAVVVIGCAMGNLSQTAVNSMMVYVGTELGFGVGIGQLLTTLYMLVLGITVPAISYLANRFSMRKILLVAWTFLTVGSLANFFAQGFGMMVTGRVLQAISTGMTMPLTQSIAMTKFPPGKQGTAMGISGIAMGFAPNIGPLVGGWFAQGPGWRWFFCFLLVFSAILIICTLLVVPKENAPARDAHLDVLSLVYSTLGFGGLLVGFSNVSNFGFGSLFIWIPMVLGLVFSIAFVLRQKRVENPLIHLDVFQAPNYSASFWALICLCASFLGITLIIPLYVQNLCGGTAVDSGIVFIPAAVVAFIFNPVSGILTDRVGARPVLVTAGFFLVIGSSGMAFIGPDTPLWVTTLLQTIRAIGVSSSMSPFLSWGLANVPGYRMVDASSFQTTTRQVAASIGTAIMVFFIMLGSSGVLPSAAWGFHLAFGFSAVLSVVTLVIVILSVKDRPEA